MDNNNVQSVERTFSIIEALSAAPRGAALSELSTLTSLSKSTVHRLLASLISMGYAAKDEETGKYVLTIKLFEMGSRVINKLDMLAAARPFLESLSLTTGEAVHLVVRSGNDIVYIFKEDSGNNSVIMSSSIGLRSPMYCTSVGKAILSELPGSEVESIWDSSSIVRRTLNTITNLNELKKQLGEIRTKGFAVDDEENETGVRCVGASITDYRGKVLGAFSVSAPAGRMQGDRLAAIIDLVLKTRKEIGSTLGMKTK